MVSGLMVMEYLILGALGLERNCAKYAYLKESGCISVKTINDVEDFRYTEVHEEPYDNYISHDFYSDMITSRNHHVLLIVDAITKPFY